MREHANKLLLTPAEKRYNALRLRAKWLHLILFLSAAATMLAILFLHPFIEGAPTQSYVWFFLVLCISLSWYLVLRTTRPEVLDERGWGELVYAAAGGLLCGAAAYLFFMSFAEYNDAMSDSLHIAAFPLLTFIAAVLERLILALLSVRLRWKINLFITSWWRGNRIYAHIYKRV